MKHTNESLALMDDCEAVLRECRKEIMHIIQDNQFERPWTTKKTQDLKWLADHIDRVMDKITIAFKED